MKGLGEGSNAQAHGADVEGVRKRVAELELKLEAEARESGVWAQSTALSAITQALRDRVKRLSCLDTLSTLIEQEHPSLGALLDSLASLIPAAWRHPEVARARVELEGEVRETEGFRETPWVQVEPIHVQGRVCGRVSVCYLEERCEEGDDPFAPEERQLLATIARRIGRIAEHRRAEVDWERASELNRQIVASAHEGIVVYGRDLRYQVWNPFMERITGLGASDVLGKHPLEVFPFLRQVGVLDSVERALAGEIPGPIEFPFKIGDKTGWAVDTNAPLRNEQGEVIGVIATVQEISERKTKERQQALAAALLACLNDQTAVETLIREILRLVKASTEAEAVGIRLREGDDFPYFETSGIPETFVAAERYLCSLDDKGTPPYGPDGHPLLECTCGRVLSNHTDPTKPWFTKSGSFWSNSVSDLLANLSACDRPARTRGRCHAMGYESIALIPLRIGTETIGLLQLNDHRKNAFSLEQLHFLEELGLTIGLALGQQRIADALRESEFFFRESQRAALIGSYRLDAVRGAWRSSEVLDEIWGIGATYPRTYQGWVALVHPDDREMLEEYYARNVLAARRPFAKEYRIVRPSDGEVRWVLGLGKLELDPQGNVLSMIGTVQDVTERKLSEEALRESEERFRRAVVDSPFPIMLHAENGAVLQVSQSWCDITGYAAEELTTINDWTERAYGERKDASRAQIRELYALDHRKHHGAHLVDAKDGSTRTWEFNSAPLGRMPDGRRIVMTIALDITERRRAEAEREKLQAQLNQAQKMEAIGTLAGGVAHDFNNILAGVLSGLSLLELELGHAALSVQSEIDDMKGLVQRGADLAKQLLGFSRRGKYDVRPLDLTTVAQKTSAMYGRTRRDITFQCDFAPNLLPVLMDYGQLEQVLLNLFLNAGQAMPTGGRVLVRAENTASVPSHTAEGQAKTARFVKLVVADTGIGMDLATQARVFEPFFTTKAPGHGSGLGLASVYGIVTNHGGLISVESEPGNGTAFTILLPGASEPAPAVPRGAPSAPNPAGQGTILVVDDEEQLLRVCARLLRRMGYEVLTAAGGKQAVELVREHGRRISLIILDLTMPDMSGLKTYEAVRDLAPKIKVLLSSGYSVDGQAQELLARGCDGFIQKPFDIATLSDKIRSIQ